MTTEHRKGKNIFCSTGEIYLTCQKMGFFGPLRKIAFVKKNIYYLKNPKSCPSWQKISFVDTKLLSAWLSFWFLSKATFSSSFLQRIWQHFKGFFWGPWKLCLATHFTLSYNQTFVILSVTLVLQFCPLVFFSYCNFLSAL